jgi:hypothetical protein
MEEHYIIEYLNSKKNFQKDCVQFHGPHAHEKAVTWGQENLESFNLDMLKVVFQNISDKIEK